MDVTLAFGAKVSNQFALRVIQAGKDFNLDPSWLMTCMEFESNLNPAARNPKSSATGLIQFMDATAAHYNVTTAQLAAMTAEEQFDYVWLYFRDAIKVHGPLTSLADCYLAILWPQAIGKTDDYALWVLGAQAYTVNAGLDTDLDHKVTKGEVAARITALYDKGLLPPNVANIVTPEPAPVQSAPQPPKESILMSLVSDAFRFVWDHTFAAAARTAATDNPVAAQAGIAAVQAITPPTSGPSNSPAGVASPAIAALEDDLNTLVANFLKTTIDQVPGIGGVAEVTGLDQKAADAAKALLVLAEQHALTYLSALFSHGHAAVNAATVPASNGGAVAPQPSSGGAPQ